MLLISAIIPLFIPFRWIDAVDILFVALLLYELYNLVKGTGAINILLGIVAVVVLWKIVTALEMALLGAILGAFISVGFIALIVVFQPEIRKFLLLVGNPGFIQQRRRRFLFWRLPSSNDEKIDIDALVTACQRMSHSKTGALLVIARTNELEEFVQTGVVLDARITPQLIENLFFKNSPLHDGAVIISNDRIRAAACILPVSADTRIPVELGLRHRAGLGISEKTDALAIVVSEETGEISLMKNGVIIQNVKPTQVKNFLEKEFHSAP